MKINLLILLIILLTNSVFCQKQLDIPSNETGNFTYVNSRIKSLHLNDLTENNNDLTVRIWIGRHVVEISQNIDSVSGKIVTFIYPAIKFSDKIIYKSTLINSEKIREMMNIINSNDIFSMKGEDTSQALFHGDIIIFEISSKDNYRIFSYYPVSGTEAEKVNIQTQDLLDFDLIDMKFINKLPSGFYFKGLSPFLHLDRFCKRGKITSSLYRRVKRIIMNKLYYDKTMDVTEFPIIILNNKAIKMCDLNNYENEQVDKSNFLVVSKQAIFLEKLQKKESFI